MTPLIRSNTGGFMCLVLHIGIFSWITRVVIAAGDTCGRPARTPNSVHVPAGFSFEEGAKIRYSCINPYDIILGHSERKCLRDGSWSGDMPICSKPALIEEAQQDNEDLRKKTSLSTDGNISTCVGTTVYTQTVWEGYISAYENISASEKISAVQIVLQGNSGLKAYVEIRDDSSHASFHATKCTENFTESTAHHLQTAKIFTFFCPAGTTGKHVHINISHVSRICEVFVFRQQVQQCLSPDIPGHGNGHLITSGIKSEYQFNCHSGYKRWGALKTSCQADGTWIPKSPVCKEIVCYPPPQPDNGKVEYDLVNGNVPYNGIAKYSCNVGFYLEGQSTITCHQWNTWKHTFPECKAITAEIFTTSKASYCDTLPPVANGYLAMNNTDSGLTAWLKCNEGFRPLATNHIVCLNTGEWRSQSLSCTIIQCEANPVVPHGAAILLNNSTYYGAHLRIVCNKGYSSDEAIIRKCEESGTWGDLNVCIEITCGSLLSNETNGGKWISLKDSHSMRILICPEGFHIEGSPPVTQCLSNGTWSYTSAKCKNSLEDNFWGSSWPPSLMLTAAVAVGAITAICILCLAVIFFGIRKRRQTRTDTTVFHLGDKVKMDATGVPNFLQAKHRSATGYYDETIEMRPKTVSRNPRKPRSALPNLPLDADPVYAQPFETATATTKMSTTAVNKKDDLYNAHIYAEPVDARISSSESNNVPISMSLCRIGIDLGISDIKTSLRNESSITRVNQQDCDKTCAIYDSSGNTSIDQKHRRNSERAALETFTDHSQYLEFV